MQRHCFADINRWFVDSSKSDWAVDRLRMRNHPRGFVGTVCLSSPTLTSNLRVRAESPAHTGIYYSALTVVLNPCFNKASALSTVHALAFWLSASACSATEGGNSYLLYHRSKIGRVNNDPRPSSSPLRRGSRKEIE